MYICVYLGRFTPYAGFFLNLAANEIKIDNLVIEGKTCISVYLAAVYVYIIV